MFSIKKYVVRRYVDFCEFYSFTLRLYQEHGRYNYTGLNSELSNGWIDHHTDIFDIVQHLPKGPISGSIHLAGLPYIRLIMQQVATPGVFSLLQHNHGIRLVQVLGESINLHKLRATAEDNGTVSYTFHGQNSTLRYNRKYRKAHLSSLSEYIMAVRSQRFMNLFPFIVSLDLTILIIFIRGA